MEIRSEIIILALSLSILSFSTRGIEGREEAPVHPRVQMLILLKALTYDRNFEKRVGDKLIIGILYDSEDEDSQKIKKGVSDVLDSLSGKTVKGVPFIYVDLNYNSDDSFKNSIETKKIDVLYVTPSHKWDIESIVQVSQKTKMLTITGVTEYVTRGISLGIGLKESKPEIWINLDSARAEGSDFDSNLLKLCRVIRR